MTNSTEPRTCSRCGGQLYAAEFRSVAPGLSRQVYRHEEGERVTCPVPATTFDKFIPEESTR